MDSASRDSAYVGEQNSMCVLAPRNWNVHALTQIFAKLPEFFYRGNRGQGGLPKKSGINISCNSCCN